MIKVKFDHTAFTASAPMADFYLAVGVGPLFEDGTIKTLNQVWANDREMEHLRKALRRNIRRVPENRGFPKKKNNDIANQDWSLNGPVHSTDVPLGELWIYETPEEAKQLLEERFAAEHTPREP